MQSSIPSCRRCQRFALTISAKHVAYRRASTLRASAQDWDNTSSTSASSSSSSRHSSSFHQSFPPSTARTAANPIQLPKSRKEAHHLLYQLATSHRSVLLRDIQHTTAPALDRLVKLRHYAGAREILEAIFIQVNASNEALSAKNINRLLLAIVRVDPIRPSQAALTSLLRYFMRTIVTRSESYYVDTDTIRLLLSVPDYVSPSQIPDILALAKRNMDSNSALKHDIGILHSIMQVYARHRNFQMADMWMQAIQAAKNLGYTAAYKPSQAMSTSRKRKGKAKEEDFETPDPDTMLSTTYLSSFASTSQSPVYTDIDLLDAISYFNEILHAKPGAEEDTRKEPNRGKARKMDVHAWTAIMSAAAADTVNVNAKSLLVVLSKLLSDQTLPNPNIVTYTVVMRALVSREEAKLALLLFEDEILPLVQEGLLELDARALMAVGDAWKSLGRLDNALHLLRYFGKQSMKAREQDLISELSRLDGEAEPNYLPFYTPRRRNYGTSTEKDATLREYAPLNHTVQLDPLILNNTLASLARAGRFKTVWLLYSAMEAVYGVVPDEATLAILAKTAISVEAWSKRRLHQVGAPLSTKDVYWPEHDGLESAPPGRDSTIIWRTKKPHVVIRRIFWNMLEGNYPQTSLRARQAPKSAASRLFARFVGGTEGSEEIGEGVQTKQQTNALSDPASHKESIPYPHLVPTASNMHVFIALLGYFGMASEIPMAMRYMKELDITPARKTLCLAMWTYEESGVYASHIRQFHSWLRDWLGNAAVPEDEEVGAFRRQQWDDPRLAPPYPE